MVADAVQLAGAVQVAGTASPLSSDVAAVEARLAVREPLPLAEADPAPASASAEAEAAQEKK
jgi:hypothetical protein